MREERIIMILIIVEFDKSNISLFDFIGYQLDLEEITGKKIGKLLMKNDKVFLGHIKDLK